jgi:MFS family permease
VAVVLLAAWLVSELRSPHPMIDMRMMRLPAVWTTNVVSLLFGASMFGVFAFLPQLMQVPQSTGYGFGASVTEAGLLMLPMMVTMAIFGSISGPLTRWVSGKAQLVIGSALAAVSCLSLALDHDSRTMVTLAGGIFGIGLGLVYASMISLIVQSVPLHQTGAASGMNTNIRTIGASIGTAIVSSVVTSHPGPQGLPAESGYTESFLVLAVVALAAIGVALLVPTAKTPSPASDLPEVLPELTPVEV